MITNNICKLIATSASTSLLIMGIIILGLCVLGVYCNRTRLAFEKSEETAKKPKKKKGFEKLGDIDSGSQSRGTKKSSKRKKNKTDYNDFYNEESSDDDEEDFDENMDDTMVSQTVKLGKNSNKRKGTNIELTKSLRAKKQQSKVNKNRDKKAKMKKMKPKKWFEKHQLTFTQNKKNAE